MKLGGVSFDSVPRNMPREFLLIKRALHENLTGARYQQEVLDMEVIPLLRNHGGMQWLMMVLKPIGQGPSLHKSECKQHKCRQLSPQTTRLKHNWKHLGSTKRLFKANRGYSNHTENTISLRVEQPPSELRSGL